jgi:hypothetical protein
MAKYVVKIEHRETGDTSIIHSDAYLMFVSYNPYNKPHELTDSKVLTTLQREAFKFRTRAAAEVIAATWGGRVVKLWSKGNG